MLNSFTQAQIKLRENEAYFHSTIFGELGVRLEHSWSANVEASTINNHKEHSNWNSISRDIVVIKYSSSMGYSASGRWICICALCFGWCGSRFVKSRLSDDKNGSLCDIVYHSKSLLVCTMRVMLRNSCIRPDIFEPISKYVWHYWGKWCACVLTTVDENG